MTPATLVTLVAMALATPQGGESTKRNEGPALRMPTLPKELPAAELRPGTYETKPYAMIVVVPKSDPDQRMVVGRQGGSLTMPGLRPELRFIPREPAKK
jgi:hypothetical protein